MFYKISGHPLAMLCLLSLSAFPLLLAAADKQSGATNASAADELLPASLRPVSAQPALPAAGEFSVPARVISLQDVMISAEIAANIEHITVDVGDKVKKGDELARLDCREFNLEEEQAQADLKVLEVRILAIKARIASAKNELAVSSSNVSFTQSQTQTAQSNVAAAHAELVRVQAQTKADQAQCQLAVLEVKRARELRRRQVIAQQELDKAEAVFRAAQANCNAIQPQITSATAKLNAMKSGVVSSQVAVKVQQAKARVTHSNIAVIEAEIPALNAQIAAAASRLRTAQLTVSRCRLNAPFSGEVVKRVVQIGQRIGIGEDAFQIVSTRDKEIMASLADEELVALKKAKHLQFQLPEQSFAVKFRASVPVVSGEALTREVRFVFDKANALPIGKTGRIVWEDKGAKQSGAKAVKEKKNDQ